MTGNIVYVRDYRTKCRHKILLGSQLECAGARWPQNTDPIISQKEYWFILFLYYNHEENKRIESSVGGLWNT